MVDGFKLYWEQVEQSGRRPQGRVRDRRHDLQSRPGDHPGAPPGAPGEGASHDRPAVRARGPGGGAGQQGDRRSAGDGYRRRRQRDQVGPHADRGAHRGVGEPDRPSVRRLPLQGARRPQRHLHRPGLHLGPRGDARHRARPSRSSAARSRRSSGTRSAPRTTGRPSPRSRPAPTPWSRSWSAPTASACSRPGSASAWTRSSRSTAATGCTRTRCRRWTTAPSA